MSEWDGWPRSAPSNRECHRDRTKQFALEVHGTPAHALQDARTRERTSGQARENQGLLRADVFDDAEDLDAEVFYAASGKDRLPGAAHARPDLLQWEELSLPKERERDEEAREATSYHHTYILPPG